MIKILQLFYQIKVLATVGYYLLIAFPLVVSAAQVTLQWDPNQTVPEGYNLYQRIDGQTYNYSNPINPASISETTFTVNDLQEGVTYYFVVRAFIGSNQSGDSNEVVFSVPAAIQDADADGFIDPVDAFPNDSNINEYNSGSNPSLVPGNISPAQPQLAEPSNSATGVDLVPILMTEAFQDSDHDGHARTHYQIAVASNWDATDSTDYVFDGVFAQHLTSLPLGDMILDPETTYYWRVKFYDSRNGESEWSATWHFTTGDSQSAGYMDNDGDGIADEQEVALEDINADWGATPDMLVIGSEDITNPQLAIMHSSSADVVAIRAVDADAVEIGSNANRPAILTGLLSFKLRLLGDAVTASMTVYFAEPAPANANWYKYSIEEGWVVYPDATFSSDRKSVSIYLVDGGAGDDDGVQNGIIVDPSGLGYSMSDSLGYNSQTSNVSSSSDSSGAGCFIAATADDLGCESNSLPSLMIFGLLGAAIISGMVTRQ
jgi:chitinase